MKKFFVRCYVRWCEYARNSFAPRFLYPSKVSWIMCYVTAVLAVVALLAYLTFEPINLDLIIFFCFAFAYCFAMGNGLLLRWIYLKHCFPYGLKATYERILPDGGSDDVQKEE